jgi:hypothetical protein
MIDKRGILITIISLVFGGLLSLWLYMRFKIVFFFLFVPFFSMGGRLFRTILRNRDPARREIDHDDYTVEDE